MDTCLCLNTSLKMNKLWKVRLMGSNHVSLWLLLIVSLFFSANCRAADDSCGQPPMVNDENIKGTVEGKAKLLATWIGDAALSGQIQAERKDIFSKTPDGLKNRADAYLQYQVCIFLMDDKKLSTTEKIDQLIRVRQSFQVPVEGTKP
ncbi:hypothetical protein [Enterobacter soli]|uniref:Uncharacterized protein n=1 Tax=Enterobacter soli TaxID=885040 RepID=A0AAW8HB04_9ENTR|nr:hypothetical protein [Enterobacter soli]MDQ2258085.1 hypothetical protein [Enterobacter soli]MDQ2334893.1 hypothetical protein [Enterobacter soli]HDR2471102.1 hypothetical protein [Enterobacter soli]HDR2475147.1 hypothetical protein [Enterobacter soli]HEE9786424.1 hypothetical protein [Enterobacter soli]